MGAVQAAYVRASSTFLGHIENAMGNIGSFTAKKPFVTMFASVFLLIVLLPGWIFLLETETDGNILFAPYGTDAREDTELIENTFLKEFYQAKGLRVAFYDTSRANIYTEETIDKFKTIHEAILALSIVDGGVTYNFENGMCYDRTPTGACMTQGPYSMLRNNASNFPTTDISNSFLITDPNTLLQYPTVSYYSGVEYETLDDGSKRLNKATALMQNYGYIQYPDANAEAGAQEDRFEDYEVDWLDLMEGFRKQYTTGNLVMTMQTPNAVNYENAEATGGDIIFVIITFDLLGVFAIVFSYRSNLSESKMILGVIGVISSAFAIPAAFGVCGYFGVPNNSVIAFAPFLILGIGIDDMFVIVRAFDLTSRELTVEQRILHTMKSAGVGIFFTSVTDFTAFMIGLSSSWKSIQGFCFYSAFGVLFDFIFQCTFFLSCLVIQARYEKKAYEEKKEKENAVVTPKAKEATDDDTQEKDAFDEPEKKDLSSDLEAEEMEVWISRADTVNQFFKPEDSSDYFKQYVDFILQPIPSLVILLCFCVWLSLAIYGISDIPVGQRLQEVVSKDSFVVTWYDMLDNYYDTLGLQFGIYATDPQNFWEPSVQSAWNELKTNMDNDECIAPDSVNDWLAPFLGYANAQGLDVSTQTTFMAQLDTWLANKDLGARYEEYLIRSSDKTSITSASFLVNMRPPKADEVFSTSWSNCLPGLRDICDKSNLAGPVFPWWESIIHADGNLIILKETLLNLMFAALASWFICLILIPSLRMSIIVLSVVLCILAGVVGYLKYWGNRVDVVVGICLVMTIGFAVDNSAHICHAFYHSKRKTRKEKVVEALNLTGLPILFGDITTILALISCAFSSSQIFLTFFRSLFLVMIFGGSFAVMILPIVLTYIGPMADHHEPEKGGDKFAEDGGAEAAHDKL